MIGGKYNDRLDGGRGNDILKGMKGADTYVISPGQDKIVGFKMKEGDTIEIDLSIAFEMKDTKRHALLVHDMGITKIMRIKKNASELIAAIEIV